MISTACRLCSSTNLRLIIDLNFHPLGDTFLPKEALDQSETRYPLRVLQCADCGHAFLQYVVPEEERYQKVDYSYTAGNSPVSVKHFGEMATEIIADQIISANDLVVDIGGNDGTLLKAFKDQSGCKVLNVEPAGNIAKISQENGIATHHGFFDSMAASKIKAMGGAKAITGTNVFNHINDLPTFMKDVKEALTPDGAFVFEAPSLLELVKRLAFDTIYLEHVSFFGMKPLVKFFETLGLHVHRIEASDYMGGSFRVYVKQTPATNSAAQDFIALEDAAQLYDAATYEEFMAKVRKFRSDLMSQLYDIKAKGGKIVGIGAATKGNTLLNYCGIDNGLLECVTDSSPLKIGKYTPGSHLPIIPDAEIPKDATHALILPWNIGNFLKEKLKHLNLEFIVPHMDGQA
ncbi:class I SAM-dependent methyltransferase [Candidatus Uhrbacteria bacterium]|nr:class I SAM-dependent methyltransferase [Candidatus Uhrbacteria bacterium]